MKKAILMTITAIVVCQLGSGLAKNLFEVAGPLAMAWLRVTTAAALLLVFVRPKLRHRTRTDWLVLLGYAVTLVTMNVSFYQAIARIPIGLAVTIEFLGPLAVAVIKSRGWRDLIWVGLAGAGVALLGWSPDSLTLEGVLFALVAATCWGCYILITPHTGRRWPGPQPVVVANLLGSAVLIIPVLTLFGQVFTSPWVWAVGFAVGLLSSVLPYWLELAALRSLDQRIFSILMSIEPAAGALSGLIILGERLSLTDIAAMACVMTASLGITITVGRAARMTRECTPEAG